jgi:hypothetical protein
MKRNIELNGLGPTFEPSSSEVLPGKIRVNEGDAWYAILPYGQHL